jgi:hypothetical protein
VSTHRFTFRPAGFDANPLTETGPGKLTHNHTEAQLVFSACFFFIKLRIMKRARNLSKNNYLLFPDQALIRRFSKEVRGSICIPPPLPAGEGSMARHNCLSPFHLLHPSTGGPEKKIQRLAHARAATDTTIVPARILNSCSNSEGGVLYSMYPHRVFTAGRKLATGRSLDIALATLAADASFVQANEAGPTASMRPRSQAPSTRSRHG